MKSFVFLAIIFLAFSASAQTKRRSKQKPKSSPTAIEVKPLTEPPAAGSPEWIEFLRDNSKDGKTQTLYSYQLDSLNNIAPHTYRFWIEAKEVEKEMTYRALLWLEVNCQKQEYDFRRLISYDKNGAVVSDDDLTDSELSEVLPGTLSAAIFTKICAIAEK